MSFIPQPTHDQENSYAKAQRSIPSTPLSEEFYIETEQRRRADAGGEVSASVPLMILLPELYNTKRPVYIGPSC